MRAPSSAGQIVCSKANPSRPGPVIEVLATTAGRVRYRVFHSPSEIREYYEEKLAPATLAPRERSGSPGLLGDSILSAEEFRARLTALRLANPLTDNLYALHVAELTWDTFTIDHINPDSKGRRTQVKNAALTCRKHNSKKGNRSR